MVELVEIHDLQLFNLPACLVLVFFGFGGIGWHDFSDGSLTFLSDSSFLIPG